MVRDESPVGAGCAAVMHQSFRFKETRVRRFCCEADS